MANAIVVGLLAAIPLGLAFAFLQTRAQPINLETISITLSSSPNHMTRYDVISLFALAVLKHVLSLTSYSASLRHDRARSQVFALPHMRIEGRLDVNLEDARLFKEAMRSQTLTGEDRISPFFLVAMTVPLVIRILVHRACPVKPLGAVNTRNEFKFLDAKTCRDIKGLIEAARAGSLSYKASFGGPENAGLRRKRGFEFCIAIDVLYNGRPILQQELWFLQFLPPSTQPRYEPPSIEEPVQGTPKSSSDSAEMHLYMDRHDPQRWAATCKDYNPIHISPLGAKLFGFKSVIAHGNHVAALVFEGLLERSSCDVEFAAREVFWKSERPFAVEVRFLRPLTLPAETAARWRRDVKNEIRFAVVKQGKESIAGAMTMGP